MVNPHIYADGRSDHGVTPSAETGRGQVQRQSCPHGLKVPLPECEANYFRSDASTVDLDQHRSRSVDLLYAKRAETKKADDCLLSEEPEDYRTTELLRGGGQHHEPAVNGNPTYPVALDPDICPGPAGHSKDHACGSQKAAATLGMSPAFVGFIIVALVGAAAEMTVAFSAARKNHLDMSVSIALGSASQIALFVAPVLVLLSYFIGPKPMDLQFWPGAVTMVMIAAVTATFITNSGRSAWFIGVLLVFIYIIFAMTLYMVPPGAHGAV